MKIPAFLFIILFSCECLLAQPISLHPENTHYFLYNGKATVLITSGEHYGSVINPDFNFDLYLETLQKSGFNHTRIFMGDYAEAKEAFCIIRNSLSPENRMFLTPWKRSTQDGFALGGNKFDLDQWNPDYFTRLHRFIKKANELGIVVECVFFFEGMSWDDMPMNPKNNVNGTTNIKAPDYMSLSNGNILDFQRKYILKLVNELNQYDNVIFNIANEPWFFNQEYTGFSSPARDETKAWFREVSDWIINEEKKLPKKHILSVDYCNEGQVITNEELEKYWTNISVFNHHYDKDAASVRLNYKSIPRAFAFNETGLMPKYSEAYRIQGWRYMMSGGALYNNLDFTFQVGHEDGSGNAEFSCEWYQGSGDPRVRMEISQLAKFFNTLDFVHMQPVKDLFTVYFGDREYYILANPGRQYAIYVLGGVNTIYRLSVPFGKYRVSWIDPATGIKIRQDEVNHTSGELRLQGPDYKTDMAIRIDRMD
jgi:hypothetical protein